MDVAYLMVVFHIIYFRNHAITIYVIRNHISTNQIIIWDNFKYRIALLKLGL